MKRLSPEDCIRIFERVAKRHRIKYNYNCKSREVEGYADFDSRQIFIRKPTDKEKLLIAFHEMAHVLNGVIEPLYLGEYIVMLKAFKMLRKEGIVVSRKYIFLGKNCIAKKLMRGIVENKVKKIDNRVKRYIQKDFPTIARGKIPTISQIRGYNKRIRNL